MSDLTSKIIMLVDDDPDYLFQLRVVVELLGYNTITADSQREAEKIIKSVQPDLAILDLMMENEDSGFILCHKIKNLYPDVPIIIATGVTAETGFEFDISSEENRKWIKADLLLDKGIRKDQLDREIKRLLNK
ncbi:MAG: response regulator [Bacteroidales bacterium]|nr:response regulator [Bacteroidales bacterium]